MPIITINLHLYHVAGVKRVAVGEVCKTASWWIKAEYCNKLAGLWRDMSALWHS